MEAEDLKKIIQRHKFDDGIYKKIGDSNIGGQSHLDRAALLEHIDENSTIANSLAIGCSGALGKATGFILAWAFWIWIFRSDIVQAAAWFAAHVRVTP